MGYAFISPAPAAAAGAPFIPAVKANRPLPPVEVRTGEERVPSSAIFREMMLAPAGLLSRK
jgi:hypothetical protein